MKRIRKASRFLLAGMLAAGTVCQSVLPLAALEDTQAATVINVLDYGADATGQNDSMPAVKQAIEAAKKVQGSVTISFPKGRYSMYPDQAYRKNLYLSNTTGAQSGLQERTIALLLEDMNNVTLDGGGSMFIFHGKMTPYAAISCDNVTFQNFEIDFEVPSTVEMYTESVDTAAKTAIFHIPENSSYSISGTNILWSSDKSPYTGQPYWTATNTFNQQQSYNAVTGKAVRNNFNPFSNRTQVEDLGNNRVKFTYSALPANLAQGMTWQSRNSTRDQVAAALLYSKDVSLLNIKEHYVHGFGIIVQMIENITLNGLVFDTAEGSLRATSSSADDINMSGVKGKVDIQNCTFRNPHDDPINIHGTFLMVTQKIASNKIKVTYQHNETSGFPNYFVGDQVEFSVKGSMTPVADSIRTVTAVDGPDGFGSAGQSNTDINSIILTLDKDIPSEVSANSYLVENISYTPDVYIANNRFITCPTRGLLCTTRGQVLIENNLFDNMNMAGIYISCDGQSWYESGRVNDVTIRGNTFINGGTHDIFIEPTNPSVSVSNPVHHNITIEDNTFYADGRNVLNAKSTEGITFQNNRIYRKTPIASMRFTAPKDTLALGESMQLNTSYSMNSVNANLFSFNGCSNIVFAGNVYDPGLKPSISYANGTSAAQVSSSDQSGTGSVLPENASVYYESSDPDVISLSSDGLAAAKSSGTATIRAYVISGTRKFLAGSQEITVTGQAQSGESTIEFTSIPETLAAGQTSQLAVSVSEGSDSVTWSVLDAATGQNASQASISTDGLLSAVSGGLVIVQASCNGASICQAVVIEQDSYVLSETASIANLKDADGLRYEENTVAIQSLHQGYYQEQNPGNAIAFDLPQNSENLTLEVKVQGYSTGNWGCNGLYLLQDADNYISIERKNRDGSTEKMAVIREAGQSAQEAFENGSEASAPNVAQNDIWYKLEKKGTSVTGYYSLDGSTWKSVGSKDASFMSGTLKAVISASKPNASTANGEWVTFSDLKINGEAVAMTQKAQAPLLESASLIQNEDSTQLEVSTNPDADVVCLYEAADNAQGPWTLLSLSGESPALDASLNGKYIRAKVYPISGSAVGTPVVTQPVQIEDAANPTAAMKNSDARLQAVSVNDQSLDADQSSWLQQADAETTSVRVHLEALDDGAALQIYQNNQLLTEKASSVFDQDIALHHGYNLIEIEITSQDQKTKEYKRLQIYRSGNTDSTLKSISVNGVEVPIDTQTDSAQITLDAGTNMGVIEAAANNPLYEAKIYQNGAEVTAAVELEEGANVFTIVSRGESTQAPRFTTLRVVVPAAASVQLSSASFGPNAQIEQAFSAGVYTYTVRSFTHALSYTFAAALDSSRIEVFEGDEQTPVISAVGQVSWNAALTDGTKKLTVKVSSADGSASKSYEFEITPVVSQYISDLEWISASSGDPGDNPVRRDLSCSNNTIRMRQNGEIVEFAKGVGTHGASVIEIDLSQQEYTRFTSYVGVDQNVTKTSEPNEIFRVLLDGEEVFNSGLMTYTSEMQRVDVDVAGKSKLTLELKGNSNTWSCHGNWADAQLLLKEDEPAELNVSAQNGGEVKKPDCSVYLKETVSVLAVPNEGYTFVGWLDEEGNLVSSDCLYTFTLTKAASLQACFEEIIVPKYTYTVTYHLGAGSMEGEKQVVETSESESGEYNMPLTDKTIIPPQWRAFAGWADVENAQAANVSGSVPLSSNSPNKDLYAVYTQIIPADQTTPQSSGRYANGGAIEQLTDENSQTYTEADWSAAGLEFISDAQNRWYALSFAKPQLVGGIKYLGRDSDAAFDEGSGNRNGFITEYILYAQPAGSDEWVQVGSGTWDQASRTWNDAAFDRPVLADAVRVQAVHTYSDNPSLPDKLLTGAELRAVWADQTVPLSEAMVKIPASVSSLEWKDELLSVQYGETQLTEHVDYSLDVDVLEDALQLTVTGQGGFTGTVTKTIPVVKPVEKVDTEVLETALSQLQDIFKNKESFTSLGSLEEKLQVYQDALNAKESQEAINQAALQLNNELLKLRKTPDPNDDLLQ